MTLDFVIKTLILLWPLILLLAVATLFIPDRVGRAQKAAVVTTQKCFFIAVLAWGMLIAMAQSVRHQGDIGKEPLLPKVWEVFVNALPTLTSSLAVTAFVAYGALGLLWAVAYFWLYARRLGQQYVMERDLWMRTHGLKTLEGVTDDQRKEFGEKVIGKVKGEMFYDGDFPLRPLQQKRFFAANLTFWPATLVAYLFGDLALDIARQIWFTLRAWIHRKWTAGMLEYLADEETCQMYSLAH